MRTSVLKLSNVCKIFPPDTVALEGFNLEVHRGELIGLIGPGGCGKTTALRIITGLDFPTSGGAFFNGKPIRRVDYHRSMIFQDTSLYPWMTILENTAFGPISRGIGKEEAREKAVKWLSSMGLKRFLNSYPYELSGGLQRRAFIAQILANEPDVLLCDEPFGGLDWFTRMVVCDQLLRLWYEKKLTIVYVTHTVEDAVYMAQKVCVMTARPGKIREIVKIDLPEKRWELGEELRLSGKYMDYVERLRSISVV